MSNNAIVKATPSSNLIEYCAGISDHPIDVKSCKLCNSLLRDDAEAEYERTKNFASVLSLLKNRGESITRNAVRNHLLSHYLPPQKKVRIEAYSIGLKDYLEKERDRKNQLRERMWMLEQLMYQIGSESDEVSLEEKRRNADIMKKISDSLTVLEDKEEEIDKKMEPVEILINNLSKMFTKKMKELQSDDLKKALMEILDEFIAGTDDIFLGERKR